MRRVSVCLWTFGVILPLTSAAAFGQANLPVENHYKVYNGTASGIGGYTVTITDQFGSLTWDLFNVGGLANPVEKAHDGVTYPMVDPVAHQMWWQFDTHVVPLPQYPVRTVYYQDQFTNAIQKEYVGQPVYLVNPALKNTTGPLPLRNHYMCYEVIGSLPLNKKVALTDQWGVTTTVIYRAKWFCNPAQKVGWGGSFPIVDDRAHLQCYETSTTYEAGVHPVVVNDQFGTWRWDISYSNCLCVPASKEGWVSTKPSTWGKIKALYR